MTTQIDPFADDDAAFSALIARSARPKAAPRFAVCYYCGVSLPAPAERYRGAENCAMCDPCGTVTHEAEKRAEGAWLTYAERPDPEADR